MVGLIDRVAETLRGAISRLRNDKRVAAARKPEGPKGPARGATSAAKPKGRGGRARAKKR